MKWSTVHSVWALVLCPRKLRSGVQTLCILPFLLIAAAFSPALADCPPAPIANTDDMAVSFLAANGVQAASASLLASSVKEGTLVYDGTAGKLKVCDGSNWIEVGSGGGTDTLGSLSCTTGQIAKYSGSAWVCADAIGGASGSAAVIAYQLTAGSDGGATVAGAWTQLPLNTKLFDSGNITTLTSNRFTLPAGSYSIRAYQVYFGQGGIQQSFRVRLRNITDGSTAVSSATCRLHIAGGESVNDACPLNGILTIAGTKTFEMQYFAQTAMATYGLGASVAPSGEAEKYGEVIIEPLSGGGGSDTLATLSCAAGEIPKWSGSAWDCAPDGNEAGASMAGAVMAFNATACPTGWTEFTPARGRFLRGIDPTGTNDAIRAAGDVQADEIKSHTHPIAAGADTNPWAAPNMVLSYRYQASAPLTFTTQSGGGGETRPKNVAVVFCLYNGSSGLGGLAAGQKLWQI